MKAMRFAVKFAATLIILLSLWGYSCTKNQFATPVDKILKELHDPTSKYVLVAAHRGDWRHFPENSLEAIRGAIALGVDIVETDVAMTRDSVLIIMHDRTIDRTTTGKGRVSELDYDSITRCRLRDPYGDNDYKVPTLLDVLLECRDKVVVNIDKGYDYYDQIMVLLAITGNPDQILIKGKREPDDVMRRMASYQNNMLYMPIIDIDRTAGRDLFESYRHSAAPLAYEMVWSEMSPEVVAFMKEAEAGGSKIWTNTLWASLCGGLDDNNAWTNGANAVYGEHIRMGATIMQTDRPGFLIDYLRSQGLHD